MRIVAFLALLLASSAQAQVINNPSGAWTGYTNFALVSGYDPTGTNDQHTALANALAIGKPVHIPVGTYAFSAPTVAPAGKSTIICDPGATFTPLPGNVGGALFLSIGGTVTSFHVTGCSFQGASTTVGNDLNFVVGFGGANDVVFDNDFFTDNRAVIIGLDQVTNSGITNSVFTNVGNYFKNFSLWAINTAYTSASIVRNGDGIFQQTVASCTSAALGIGPTAHSNGISDGTCSWNFIEFGPGATVNAFSTSGTGNFFIGNIMTNIGGDPFDAIDQLHFTAINNKVIGDNTGWINLLSGAGTGMYLYGNNTTGSVGAVVANNYIYGMTGNGIDIGCAQKLSVSGNVSRHNGGAGLSLSGINSPACAITQFSVGANYLDDNNQGTSGKVSIATNNTTAAGNNVLHFASTTGVVDGYYIQDLTDGKTVVLTGTKVVSHDATSVTMSANAAVGGVTNPATILFLPTYPAIPAPDSGLWIGCVGLLACNANLFSVNGVTATDDQSPKTQAYGIHVDSSATLANYTFSAANELAGNLTGTINGALLQDQGSGSNGWACWPGSSVVASGNFGSIACGFSATASGAAGIALGTSVVASGTNGISLGKGANDYGRIGTNNFSSGQIALTGDMQATKCVFGGPVGTGAMTLTTDATGTVSTTSMCNSSTKSSFGGDLHLQCVNKTTPGNAILATWKDVTMVRGTGNVAIGIGSTTTPDSTRVTGTAVFTWSVTADTTRQGILIVATASGGDTWACSGYYDHMETRTQ